MNNHATMQHGATAIWDSKTLNKVLAELRKLNGLDVTRNSSQQTVIVKATIAGKTVVAGQIMLRSMNTPAGWLTRYDSKLISKR